MPGQLVGDLRVIEKGLNKDDRVVVGGIMRAIPGRRSMPNCVRSPPSCDEMSATHFSDETLR